MSHNHHNQHGQESGGGAPQHAAHVRAHANLGLHDAQGAARGELRHVKARVSRLFPDRYDHDGAQHEHLWINSVTALDGQGDYQWDVFVAIRIAPQGIGVDIPFQIGHEVELQGMWISAENAQAGQDNSGLAVLHFTHAPKGFVIYDGTRYDGAANR